MARGLTEARIRAAKPKQKPYKLSDGDGLHLYVTPEGRRLWRFRYRQPKVEASNETGKRQGRPESTVSFGAYPAVSLADARKRRDDARKQLAANITPVDAKRAEQLRAANSFKEVAAEWLPKQNFSPKTLKKANSLFDGYIFPHLGKRPVDQITAPEILDVLRRPESRGKNETAHRVKSRISQVLRYAIATGRATRDVTADLRGALAPVIETHHASIKEPARIGELLRAIDSYAGRGHPIVESALKLAPLVFVRPFELRYAQWKDFTLDGDAPVWRIPGDKMKRARHTDAGRDHIVPLAPQAVAILRALHPYTGRGRYVFPSLISRDRPMSENAITGALRRLGFTGEEQTWHGFRSMASTLLNENGGELRSRRKTARARRKQQCAGNIQRREMAGEPPHDDAEVGELPGWAEGRRQRRADSATNMTFWFAEYFGSDHISQRAEIERLARLGGRRRDAVLKARALEMLVIEPSGKPKRGEPARIAKELKNCKVTSVQGWIEEFQRKVDYLVKHRCVMTRVQAWGCIKKLHPDAVIERGIQRSMLGRKAGKGPRRRSGW